MNNNDPIIFVPEPELQFGYGQNSIDPRDGLMLYGPLTRGSAVPGRIGIVGPDHCRERMLKWLKDCVKPVYSLDNDIARPFFPGLQAAFGIDINFESIVQLDVSDSEIGKYLLYSDSHQRIHNLANLFADKLIKYTNEEEVPVTVWFIVIPDIVKQYGRPQSHIPKSKANNPIGIKDKYSQSAKLLFDEYDELQEAYKYELNFHNQVKAKLLKDKIITQIVQESTIAYKDFKNKYGGPLRDLAKFESAIAWNIGTTLYYKMGGVPWKLAKVRDGVCYIGLVYKKLENNQDNRSACCAAQMFLDSGDGLVFKATTGRWYDEKTKQFHLSKEAAHELLEKALKTYSAKNDGNYPKQIFIHATTYFNDEEWGGFEKASEGKSKIVGVRIRTDATFKLYRDYKYPAPRGLAFIQNSKKAYLWTKGFIPKIKTVMGLETPNCLAVEVSKGEEDIAVVCADVLSLTKLNYNSCIYGDGLPVTLRFADGIGEIITAGPVQDLDVLPFKHYI